MVVATKGGMARLDETARGWAPARFGKGDPDGLKDRIRASRQALSGTLRGTLRGRLRGGGSVEEEDSLKPIDLWQFHHVDGYCFRKMILKKTIRRPFPTFICTLLP